MTGKLGASLFLGALALLTNACGQIDSNGSADFSGAQTPAGIIGGTEVSGSDPIAKSIVAVYDSKNGALCTGSLISDQLVLTAGHCLIDTTAKSIYIVFATDVNSATKAQTRKGTSGKVDPDYVDLMKKLNADPNLDFNLIKDQGDLSVIRFTGGLPQGYVPAQLMTTTEALKNGLPSILAGYGLDDGVNQTGAGVLRQVSIALKDANFSSTEVLFDQRSHTGACHGDSGGPALAQVDGKLLVYGVTSRGLNDPANDCSKDSVYTSVPAQLAFIQSAAKALTGKALN